MQVITYFKQVSKTLINSINIILVLHRNFIPNDNLGLLEDWEHVTIVFELRSWSLCDESLECDVEDKGR